MKLKIVKPQIKYLNQLEKLKNDFIDSGESSDGIHGSADLLDFKNTTDWIDFVNKGIGKNNWVPFRQYLIVDKTDILLGLINLRFSLNDYLLNYGGHIGYYVSPKHRNKGVASKTLYQVLQICKKEKIDKVLITCLDTNIASEKVIIKNGGVFEDVRSNGEHNYKRFWIK
ncbi:GNAT family N-acetyltransferase [Mesoplasma corruscae]|uniref:Acetyltransferase n=1 Tax=Mesoplasma corruscae TaxID=216874 RepID=A0A2S5RH84_9MOLU|nr:GNAT family N-acetyltransferase [Mesoplasma corruscae]PPE06699.1 acetyltransferase [Mesoplasma corruscae]